MKLLVDYRRGSKELHDPLCRMGVNAHIRHLDSSHAWAHFGDFAFFGNGPLGRVKVGIERKTVDEIVSALEGDKRLRARQIPGMLKTFQYAYLIVEGYARPGRGGLLMKGKWEAGHTGRRHTYESYCKFLLTLGNKCTTKNRTTLRVMPTSSFTETVHVLHALSRWWDKPWNQHRSAYEVESQEIDQILFDERTMRRQTFAQWPGIGWGRSKAVSEHFLSTEDAIGLQHYTKYLTKPQIAEARRAAEAEWCELPYRDVNGKTHRFGPGRAATLKAFLRGREVQHAKGR